MITSSVQKQLDTILTLLSDSKKLSKLIEDLKKADKCAKESFKELSKGKAYKAALEDIQKEMENCKKEVDKAKKYLKTVKNKAEKYEQDATAVIKEREEACANREFESKTKLSSVQTSLKEAEQEYIKAQKVSRAAQDEKAKATSLKKQYEEKLEDIKKRLSGL